MCARDFETKAGSAIAATFKVTNCDLKEEGA
jgi:hypothetical protein